MEVIKAFQNGDLNTNILIKETPKGLIFRAYDIGIVLGFNDINNSGVLFWEHVPKEVAHEIVNKLYDYYMVKQTKSANLRI
jgi:hypothetical protein